MSWFKNFYCCSECGESWQDEWSATCDEDCPHCGARHMSPCDSDDLTYLIEENDGEFIVLRSADDAEDSPALSLRALFGSVLCVTWMLGIFPLRSLRLSWCVDGVSPPVQQMK